MKSEKAALQNSLIKKNLLKTFSLPCSTLPVCDVCQETLYDYYYSSRTEMGQL